MTHVLEVKNLATRFSTPEGEVCAVNNVNFHINEGESVGIVGESGSGKSQIFMSIMGLLAKNGRTEGEVLYRGKNILGLPTKELNTIRGEKMSMIFQDPMTSLNPFLPVSIQMTEVLKEHLGLDDKAALQRSIEMLDLVHIPESKKRVHMYPHEFSGGMRQRVMIAMALLCEPDLLIADEPTTALDVTVQAQILDLFTEIRRELKTALFMITHDLGVVAGTCDRVLVMYGGRIIEKGAVRDVFYDPMHPYSQGLLSSMPRLDEIENAELNAIPGQPPNLQNLPDGCAFAPRCYMAERECLLNKPVLQTISEGRETSCLRKGAA